MKLPKSFKPDKNLDEKIEELKKDKDDSKSDISINQLIFLPEKLESNINIEVLNMDDIDEEAPAYYQDLKMGLGIEYGETSDDVGALILEFKNIHLAKKNFSNMIEDVETRLKEHDDDAKIFTKDNYVVCVSVNEKSKSLREYYQKLGFKERN